MAIIDRIEKHQGKFNSDRIRALIYGESGAGKTVFASTFPSPILFLDADDGMASVRTEVDRVFIDSWETLVDVTNDLMNEEHGYKTIVVDSLNEIQTLAMSYVLENFPAIKRSYDSLPAVADYGKMLRDFDLWVRAMKSLPTHVVLLCQAQARNFETDVVQPQLTGKNSSSNVCRMMDVIGYIYSGEGGESQAKRFVSFGMTNYVGKDRSGKLPSVYEIQNRDKAFKELQAFWK